MDGTRPQYVAFCTDAAAVSGNAPGQAGEGVHKSRLSRCRCRIHSDDRGSVVEGSDDSAHRGSVLSGVREVVSTLWTVCGRCGAGPAFDDATAHVRTDCDDHWFGVSVPGQGRRLGRGFKAPRTVHG